MTNKSSVKIKITKDEMEKREKKRNSVCVAVVSYAYMLFLASQMLILFSSLLLLIRKMCVHYCEKKKFNATSRHNFHSLNYALSFECIPFFAFSFSAFYSSSSFHLNFLFAIVKFQGLMFIFLDFIMILFASTKSTTLTKKNESV